jgi:hypothetical protein
VVPGQTNNAESKQKEREQLFSSSSLIIERI